jgi:hypothetical protein
VIVYVSIGNSDGKLPPERWATFCEDVDTTLGAWGRQMHGQWYSLPNSKWVNACWCVELHPENADEVKRALADLAGNYGQRSIAWAEAPNTVMIVPGPNWSKA